jgi:hypothetical protein
MSRFTIAAAAVLLLGIVSQPYWSRATDKSSSDRFTTTALATPSAPAHYGSSASVGRHNGPAPAPTTRQWAELRGTEHFWRLGRDSNGVWWFLSPTGNAEFLNTVTTVQPFQPARDADSPHFVSRDYVDTDNPPADLDRWAQATVARIRQIGFKGLGAWCNPALHRFGVPMTRDLNVWTWMNAASHRLYTPDWQPMAEQAVKTQVQVLHDNRDLVGYYIDNELDWSDTSSGPSAYFDDLPADDPNRRQVMKVAHSIWPTLDAFNAAWNTHLATWDEIDGWKSLPREPARAYDRLQSAFLEHMASDYFRITTGLIHNYDPNHLILGVRFKGYAPREVVRASRPYTDAQSLNYYVGDAKLGADMFQMMNRESGQPIVISEYAFHSLDGRSGNRDTVGFSAQVPDQQARADGYRLLTTRLARVPYVIGADWFQWNDEPPTGRVNDGEDVNFGIVDIDDRPYEKLADAVRTTTPLLNGLHDESGRVTSADIWRESYDVKPVMHVPYLVTPPVLNGELSDWSMASKLPGVRLSHTVGLDRSELPVPNVYLGWNKSGLYMGVEVFDNDILAAPAKGWWWTRDHLEFWISSKPVAPDQTEYDVNCHQFFFVPTDSFESSGVGGVVGQWHRSGDALADNLIPHPEIKQAVRILPDRYVVEMLIPTKSLHGFDPANQPTLAFNIHVKNFQHAIDYFWSAPKEAMTQLRPNTWGTLVLDPAPAGATADSSSHSHTLHAHANLDAMSAVIR